MAQELGLIAGQGRLLTGHLPQGGGAGGQGQQAAGAPVEGQVAGRLAPPVLQAQVRLQQQRQQQQQDVGRRLRGHTLFTANAACESAE